jgi:hypothetical protein
MNKRSMMGSMMAVVAATAAPAVLADEASCGKGLICASKPETVVKALQEAGYKAKLVSEKGKDPWIETSMNGYNLDLEFSNCEDNKKCKVLSYRVSFTEDDIYTLELMNSWNSRFRFYQMYRLEKGGMAMNYDFTTVGGLNQANFAHLAGWMDGMLGDMDRFIDEARTAKEKAGETIPAASSSQPAPPPPTTPAPATP